MLWIKKVVTSQYDIPFIFPNRIYLLRDSIDYDMKKYQILRAAINDIEFTCFQTKNKKGGCRKGIRTSRCCCSECHYHGGHYTTTDLLYEKDIAVLNELFKPRVGFWIKDKGCSIPRELRSLTCIAYNCEPDSKKVMIESMKNDVAQISNRIRLRCSNRLSKHIIGVRMKKKGVIKSAKAPNGL